MTALISGVSLGLSTSSAATLNLTEGNPAFGRGGQSVFVNVGTGNVVLRHQDDMLIGRGPDISALRTYNSLGALDGDNNDNWTIGFYRQLLLTGTANTSGSTVVRVEVDGAQQNYTYQSSSGKYRSTDGSGAADTVLYNADTGKWTWTDGANGNTETWQWNGALGVRQLLNQNDASGNSVGYTYNSSALLSTVTSANSSGSQKNITELVYDTTAGKTGNLLALRTTAWDAATGTNQALTRVRYRYDSSNRLASVTLDLSPADRSITDGNTWVTTYTYDGASKRVQTITEEDGSTLAFTYWASGRIASMTDAQGGVTRFDYNNTTNARTTVTDALGLVTIYDYDSSTRQLSKITAPAVNGVAATRQFSYDASGNVTRIIDGEGNAVDYQYDAQGNQTLQRDAAGNTISRTFNPKNQLATETVYLVPDPDGAASLQPGSGLTTRHVYDAGGKNQLRFVLSPEGRVTETRYDSYGQPISTIRYTANLYSLSTLAQTAVPTEATLASWVANLADKTRIARTDLSYDFRGQLASSTSWDGFAVDSSGKLVGSNPAVTTFLYDPAGLLLKTRVSQDTVTQDMSYVYDGIGRLLSSTDSLGQLTTFLYDDAGNETTQTLANGLSIVNSYDKSARLVSVVQTDASGAVLATTRYYYDLDNRLRMVSDPNGVRQWTFYDAAGRKVGELDGNNTLTEILYDKNGQVTQTIRYATLATASVLTLNPDGSPSALALARTLPSLRPASSTADQKRWTAYDLAGRPTKTVDAGGAVSETQYDGSGRIVRHTDYANTIATATLGAKPGAAGIAPSASALTDRTTRYFYDKDGQLRGTLDGEGGLVEILFDAAGRPWQRLAYATQLSAATLSGLSASTTLASIRPAASVTADIRSTTLYDARGNVSASIDGEGYLAEYGYDLAGNRIKTTRYATALSASKLASIASTTSVSAIRPAGSSADQVASATYDALNRLASETDAEGTQSLYRYDSRGNLVALTRAAATSEARVITRRYDLLGRQTGMLTGVGSAALAALGSTPTQAQVDAIYSQYGTRYAYDAADRMVNTIDASGSKTLYCHDNDGNLVATINALGEVSSVTWNVLGQKTTETRYGTRIAVATLATLNGGRYDSAVQNAISGIASASLDSTTRYAWNVDGTLATSTDALGNVTSASYDAFDQQVAITQPLGAGSSVTTTTSYDRRGLQRTQSADSTGLNLTTSRQYDAFGRLARSTDALGNSTAFGYDRLGHQVQTTDAANKLRSSTWDAFDRVLTQTDALGNVTRSSYDSSQRTMAITTPEGVSVSTTYNRHGQTLSIKDGNSSTITYTYDANGNLTQTDLPGSRNVKQRFDSADRLSQSTDANGIVTSLTYDAANRVLTRTVDPSTSAPAYSGLNLVTTYTYDAKAQVLSVQDANGVLTQNTWDQNGQLIRQTVDPSSTGPAYTGLHLVTSYGYDAARNQLSVTDPTGTLTRYVFDKLGRRIEEHVDQPLFGSGLNLVTRYGYDKNGNLVSKTDAGGNVTRYVYDANDRLVYTVDPAGGVAQIRYDAEGRVTQTIQYANAISLTSPGALSTQASISDIQARLTASGSQDNSQQNGYDKDGRLIYTVDGAGAVTAYAYDNNGNVTRNTAYATLPDSAGIATLATWIGTHAADSGNRITRSSYDSANRLTYSVDGAGAVTAYVYDNNGNVTQTTAYANLIAAGAAPSSVTASATLDHVVSKYYDAANRLTYSVDAMGAITAYAYDKNGNLTQTTAYAKLLGSAGSISDATRDQVTRKLYDAANRLTYAVSANGAVTGYEYNKNGNVTKTTAYATLIGAGSAPNSVSANSTQDRVTQYEYDAAGRQTKTTYPTVGVYSVETNSALLSNGAAGSASRVETASSLSTQAWYDGAGNIVANSDTAGDMRYQAYDAAGRLAYAVDAEGYVTAYERDALGNVTTLTRYATKIADTIRSAWGSSAPSGATIAGLLTSNSANRSITTQYDALGRVTRITEPQVIASTGDIAATAFTASPVTRHSYNAFGDVTQSQVLKSQTASTSLWLTTTHYYDARGLETATVDALGNVTTQTYDAFGNVSSRVETNTPTTSWNSSSYTPVSEHSLDRKTRYSYDLDNRQSSETRVGVEVLDNAQNGATLYTDINYGGVSKTLSAGVYNIGSLGISNDVLSSLKVKAGWQVTLYKDPGMQGETRIISADTADLGSFSDTMSSIAIIGSARSDLTSTSSYDAFGNLAASSDAAGNTTYTYYDRDNRISAVVAPARSIAGNTSFNPLTEFTRDAFGNVTAQSERANGAGTPSLNSYTTSASSDDRTTSAVFDSWGRVVQSTDALGNSQYFSWDAAGRLAKQWQGVTLAGGPATVFKRFEYDRSGRLNHIVEPPANDGQATVDTWMEYNGFGELTRKYLTVFGRAQGESWEYDNGGRVWRSNSGDGVVKVMLVDLQGNQTVQLSSASQDLSTASDAASAMSWSDLRGAYSQYDALGRMIQQTSAAGGTIQQTWDRWGNRLSASDARDASFITTWAYNANNQLVKQTLPQSWVNTTGNTYTTVAPVTTWYYDALGNQVASVDARGSLNRKRFDGGGNLVTEQNADGGSIGHQYNAFGNEVRRTDAMGNVTAYSYDKMGRMTRIDRPTAWINIAPAMDSDAVTLYTDNDYGGNSYSLGLGAYNLYGNSNASISQFNDHIHSLKVKAGYKVILYSDPNFKGYVSTNDSWNDDSVIDENRPNLDFGGITKQWWGIASSIVIERDDYAWSNYAYSGTSISMTYDELGQKKSVTNGAGETTTYGYNLRGNMTDADQSGNRWTDNLYDALGRKTWERSNGQQASGDNGPLTWSYDYFGRLSARQDLGGASSTYSYDTAGQLTHETNTRGRDTTYSYDSAGRLTEINDYVQPVVTLAFQNGAFALISGNQHRISNYSYDVAGHRVSEMVIYQSTFMDGTIQSQTVQDQTLGYDAWGALNHVMDNISQNSIDYYYDLVGNRAAEFNYLSGVAKYYAYDAMNRQILVDGQANNSVASSNLGAGIGHLVGYDYNGNRTQDQYKDSDGNLATQTYGYDALNRLISTKRDGSVVNERAYDAADRLTYSTGTDSQGQSIFYLNNYDSAGRLAYQALFNDGLIKGYVSNQYDDAGNLSQAVRGGDGIQGVSSFLTLTSDFQYVRNADGYKQSVITATRSDTRSDNGTAGDQGHTTLTYDVNGALLSITDEDKSAGSRSFYTDANGQVLEKDQGSNVLRNIVANGQVVSTKGHGVDPNNPVTSSGDPNIVWQNSSDIAFQAIDTAHPGSGPGSYRVQAGDTLQGIARGAYGDAGLWYLIADANGLRGDADLATGQMLSLPNTVGTVHNTGSTFKPYNVATVMGDTSPYTVPPSASSSNCAQIGIIIAAVLMAVLVTVVTAGAASLALGAAAVAIGGSVAAGAASTAGVIATAAVAGAIGGMAGSLASQGVMIAGGLQSSLNWTDVAIGAATGFVGGGLGAGASVLTQGVKAGSFAARVLAASFTSVRSAQGMAAGMRQAGLLATRTVAYSAVYGAHNVVSDAIGQGVRIASGTQQAFNWKATASALLTGALSGAGGTLGKAGGLRNLAGSIGGDLGGGAIGNLIMNDGQFDPTQFAADAVGSLSGVVAGRLANAKTARQFTEKYAGRQVFMLDDSSQTQASAAGYKAKHPGAQLAFASDAGAAARVGAQYKVIVIGHNYGAATAAQLAQLVGNLGSAPRKMALIACGAASDAQGADLARQSAAALKARGMSTEVTGHTGQIQLSAGAQRVVDSAVSQKLTYGADGAVMASASRHVGALPAGWLVAHDTPFGRANIRTIEYSETNHQHLVSTNQADHPQTNGRNGNDWYSGERYVNWADDLMASGDRQPQIAGAMADYLRGQAPNNLPELELTPVERRVMSAMSTTILRSEELRVPGARDLATSALQRIAEGTSSFHQAFVGSTERSPEFVMAGTGGTGAMKKAPGLYMLAEAGRALEADDNPLRWMR